MTKKQDNHGRLSFGFDVPAAPDMKDKQGRRANKTGRRAEATIYCTFKESGYLVYRQHAIGLGIYGHEIKVDLFIQGIPKYPKGLIIESKWQQSLGSVDEKFPFLISNIKQCYPCPAIIVHGGGKAKAGGIDYLKSEVDGDKLIGVFTLEELLIWINNNL